MPVWLMWVLVGVGGWILLSVGVGLFLGRAIGFFNPSERGVSPPEPVEDHRFIPAARAAERAQVVLPPVTGEPGLHILVVDDDPSLLRLLRTTFEVEGLTVEEAPSAQVAARRIAASPPRAIVLDIGMPGVDGLTFCEQLKANPRTAEIPVILLSGLGGETELRARSSGADGYVRKPFSPLELLDLVQRLTKEVRLPLAHVPSGQSETQLLAYATDVRRLLETALRQQSLLQRAYRETVSALATALAAKDSGTGAHSQRVVSYANELTLDVEPTLLDDPGLEYGFLLHDLGKLAVPDRILQKPGPLTSAERRTIQRHPGVGTDMLTDVPVLEGEGLKVVRSHHERWDGSGYPDRLAGQTIPIGARIFAVADALDAITSDRPYRRASRWENALDEIRRLSGRQFDPDIVAALEQAEDRLHETYLRLL